jgi:hypothetical protein
MKNTHFILFYFFCLLVSCSPMSKASYLKQYDSFMEDVSSNYTNYNDQDWKDTDDKFKKFDEEWYKKFEEDLSFSEKATIYKYNLQYVVYRNSKGSTDFFNKYLKNGYEDLKEKIQYYKDNQMNDDLNKLEKIAREAGDSASILFDKAINDLK